MHRSCVVSVIEDVSYILSFFSFTSTIFHALGRVFEIQLVAMVIIFGVETFWRSTEILASAVVAFLDYRPNQFSWAKKNCFKELFYMSMLFVV